MKLLISFLASLLTTVALGQSIPNGGISQNQIWTTAQWLAAWQSKADVFNPAFSGTVTVNGVQVPTYPQTTAEASAGVCASFIACSFTYAPGSVLRYLADPTGVLDSSNAVSAAISAAAVGANGGTVRFPAGIYKVTSATISHAMAITGDGIGATQIYAGDAASTVFTVTASSVSFSGFSMNASVTRTNANYFLATNASSLVQFKDLYLLGWYYGIDLEGTNYTLQNVQMSNGVATNGIGVRVGVLASPGNLSDISIINLKIDNPTGAKPFACMQVESAGDVSLIDSELQHCGQGLALTPLGTAVISSFYSVNSFFDNSGSYGVFAQPQASGAAIVRTRLIGSWASSAGTSGMLFDTAAFGGSIDGVDVLGAHVFLNGSNGISLGGTGTQHVRISESQIAQNTGNGILVNAGISGFEIQDNLIGPTGAFTGNTVDGVNISSGTSNDWSVTGNNLCGNTTALGNASTGSNFSVFGNLCATQSLAFNGVAINPVLTGTTGSIGGSALGAGACTSGTVSVTGATTSMVATASPNTYPGDGDYWDAQVTASGTVTVKVCAAVAQTPAAATYNVRVVQ